MTIVEFLQARYDAQEAGARQLLVRAQQTSLAVQEPRLLGREIPGWHDWPDVEAMCESVLREVEAKRHIVDWVLMQAVPGSTIGDDFRYPLYALALPYAAHPDYDPSWSPT